MCIPNSSSIHCHSCPGKWVYHWHFTNVHSAYKSRGSFRDRPYVTPSSSTKEKKLMNCHESPFKYRSFCTGLPCYLLLTEYHPLLKYRHNTCAIPSKKALSILQSYSLSIAQLLSHHSHIYQGSHRLSEPLWQLSLLSCLQMMINTIHAYLLHRQIWYISSYEKKITSAFIQPVVLWTLQMFHDEWANLYEVLILYEINVILLI